MTWRPVPLALILAACAAPRPVPLEEAERLCRAELAAPPRGGVTVAGGSGGVGVGLSLDVPLATIAGRDPAEAMAACVLRRAGVAP